MLTRILLAAILAGVLSGVFVTAVQFLRVTPLIQEAEKYEAQDKQVQSDADTNAQIAPHDHEGSDVAADGKIIPHAHGETNWAPEDGLERDFYTMISNILVGVSFSLILTAAILVTRSSMSLQSGMVWGMCGFVAFVLAPNFGLSPELPGMEAADLRLRQGWWLATVVATGGALLIFAFKRHWAWILGGMVLILAPHIYGAPAHEVHKSAIPANLAAEFVVATIVTSFLFWLFLGGVLGMLIQRAVASGSPEAKNPRKVS